MASTSQSKRRSFTVSFKLKAVEVAEKTSKEAAAREFKVDPKRIRDWCKQKETLKKMKKKKGQSKRMRVVGGGRKMLDEDMEKALFDWIKEMRASKFCVSRRMIKAKARDISTQEGFKASNGWLQRFVTRNKLSLRRQFTVCQ